MTYELSVKIVSWTKMDRLGPAWASIDWIGQWNYVLNLASATHVEGITMLTVTAEELAARITDLLARVAAGEEISILDHGRAVARLVNDRVRLRERLAAAVAAGDVELGGVDDLSVPRPIQLGGVNGSSIVSQDRQGRDDSIAGGL
jgi:antitoxin (DNA-binding transcriptional repressor) of toxin-antitoxin stability system